jgi:hypothetical protein
MLALCDFWFAFLAGAFLFYPLGCQRPAHRCWVVPAGRDFASCTRVGQMTETIITPRR